MDTKPKLQKKQNGRSRSFTGLASFLRSTVASFSSTFPSSRGRSSFNHRNAFSGPIAVSIVPPEARGAAGGRRRRPSSSSGYRTPEPTSPKVSCIGQVKRSKSKRAAAKVNPAACGRNGGACPLPPPTAEAGPRCRPNKGSSLLKRVLFRRSRSRSSSSSSRSRDAGRGGAGKGVVAKDPAPAPGGLGQMKRFTSGRAAFQDFDWREAERRAHDDEDEEDEDEGFVAHSAPLVLGGGVVAAEPKKEVNLWRRRTIIAPPTPLQLP